MRTQPDPDWCHACDKLAQEASTKLDSFVMMIAVREHGVGIACGGESRPEGQTIGPRLPDFLRQVAEMVSADRVATFQASAGLDDFEFSGPVEELRELLSDLHCEFAAEGWQPGEPMSPDQFGAFVAMLADRQRKKRRVQ